MKSYKLQYTKPATYSNKGWQNEVLPIGCGRMGMCIYGIPKEEHLQFNEKTLWKGGPSKDRPDYNGGNIPNRVEHLEKIRVALQKGDTKTVSREQKHLVGIQKGYGCYQNFGEIILTMQHGESTAYHRELDLNTAVCTTTYTADGVRYKREHFASFSPSALCTRVMTDTEKALHMTVKLQIAHQHYRQEIKDNMITIHGNLSDNDLEYFAQLKVITDGIVSIKDDTLSIHDAQSCDLILAAGTNYADVYPTYRGESPKNAVEKIVHTCATLGYETVKENAVTHYQSLFNRLQLDLGGEAIDMPTNALVEAFREDHHNGTEFYYEELLFQYGRYLLIASSAPDEILPANLQGVWNNSNNPIWGCDYHLNVNLQMCYWHAYVANLQELAKPMLRYMNGLRAPGRVTAACYHGIASNEKNPENGWVCHTQNTPFGWTCPGWDFYWGWSPAASSWMMQNCFDYYQFTKDEEALKQDIYPMMRENALFWLQNLEYNKAQDRYVSSPSFSPEHGPISIGNTYEQTLIWMLFHDTIEAAKIVGDTSFSSCLEKVLPKLKPIAVGKTGLLKEWYEEDDWYRKNAFLRKISYKKHGCQEHHRHASHLLGLYPGDYITADTPELLEACKKSLYERGFGIRGGMNDSGWGKANKINLWARAKEGDNAYKMLESLLSKNIAENLWDMHPPFQMDGNCGYTSGVCEMLCYSNRDYIELLPALPKVWENGSVRGIRARGGYSVDIEWKSGKVVDFTVYAKHSGQVNIKVNGKIKTVTVEQI